MNKELKRWLVAHDACAPGMHEMKSLHITDMQDAYNRASPEFLVWGVTQKGVMTQRQCVEFSLYCVRQVEDQLTDERSRAVISVLAYWLAGEVTSEETKDVADAAWAVTSCNSASYAVAYAADVVNSASHADIADNLFCVASYAADAFAGNAAGNAYPDAYAAVRKDQAQWIRENIPFNSLNLGEGVKK